MRVRLRALGELARVIGSGHLDVELPDGAILGDLLDTVQLRWGEQLPAHLWDGERRVFRGGAVIMSGGNDLSDRAAALREGQDVFLIPAAAGGDAP